VAHVAVASVVKVSIGSALGNRVARIIRQGDVLPEGVAEETLARLEQRGLIELLPSAEEVALELAAEIEAAEAAERAAYEADVKAAAEKIVADRDKVAADKVAAEKAAEAAKSQAAKQPSK
jgi:hypothetical protein